MPKKKPAKKPAAKKPRAKKPAATKKQGGAKKKQGGGTARKKLDEEVQSGQRSVVQHPDVAGIRFSQNSVDNKFTDGKSMEDLIAKLRSGEARTGEIGPPTIAGPKYLVMFRVGRKIAGKFKFLQEGDVVTLDNRRLHCMKEAGVSSVPSLILEEDHEVVLQEEYKMTTEEGWNGGRRVVIRGNDSGSAANIAQEWAQEDPDAAQLPTAAHVAVHTWIPPCC